MALIICPECGKQVSDQAATCPGCGYPILMRNNVDIQPIDTKNTDQYYLAGHLIAIISIIIAMASSVLPFFTYNILGSQGSVTLWDRNFLGLTIIGGMLLIVESLELALNKENVARDTIILGILFIVDIAIQYLYNSKKLANVETGLGSMDLSGILQPGMGFYLIVFAGIGMIVSGVILSMCKK